MAERTFIPSSPACGHWETLLAEALDGSLTPGDEAIFTAHMALCPACTALYEEARRGREWLEFLSPEPQTPAGLLDKILAQTGPGQVAGYGLAEGSLHPLPAVAGAVPAHRGYLPAPAWQRPGLMGALRRFAEPRLMMTAAMAFFSIALTLNLAGVRLSSLRLSGLRPSAVRSFMERRLTMASTPIIRYYDHLRLVYEVESKMRELRRGAEGEGGDTNRQNPKDTPPAAPGESKQAPGHKDGGSRVDPPQQSVNPEVGPARYDSSDFLESSLRFHSPAYPARPAQSGGSLTAVGEGSTPWTA